MDGLAATARIRRRETTGDGLLGQAVQSGLHAESHLPIIVVTANVRKEQIGSAIAAGAVSVIVAQSLNLLTRNVGSCYAKAI